MFSWLFGRKKAELPPHYKKLIDPDALEIVSQLAKAGFETYLVGGCVRDVLLGKKPKDFDIATKATPNQVKALVRRSFIIGRRFRIVIAKRRWRYGELTPPDHGLFPQPLDSSIEKEFQITTFRRDPVIVNGETNENVFGSAQEDAQRRDFTLNALFLDPVKGKIVDFVGGLPDIRRRTLRVIGDPVVRFKEDPIRILRALRFVARADLKMDPETLAALKSSVDLLASAKKERVREEVLKIFKEGSTHKVLLDFEKFGIWKQVCPEFGAFLDAHPAAVKRLREVGIGATKISWSHPRNGAPLFFLLLRDFFLEGTKPTGTRLEHILDNLKVSKAEREEIHRIRHHVGKILKDPEAKTASRMLPRDPRHLLGMMSAFYVVSVLAEAGEDSFATAWKHWEPEWKSSVRKIIESSGSRSAAGPSSATAAASSSSGGRSGGRRRRRSPRGRSSSTPRTPSSSGSGSTPPVSST
jgi:tRNA nucleotidyltransferase/poly(A) polymerase